MKSLAVVGFLALLGCDSGLDAQDAVGGTVGGGVNIIQPGLNLTVGGSVDSDSAVIRYDESQSAFVMPQFNQIDFVVSVSQDGVDTQSLGDDVDWVIMDENDTPILDSASHFDLMGKGSYLFQKAGSYTIQITSNNNLTSVSVGTVKRLKLVVEPFDLTNFLDGASLKAFQVNDANRAVVTQVPEGIPLQFYLEKDGQELVLPSYVTQDWSLIGNSKAEISVHPKLGKLYTIAGATTTGVVVQASYQIDSSTPITKSATVDVVSPILTEIIQEMYYPLVESGAPEIYSFFQTRDSTGEQQDIAVVKNSGSVTHIVDTVINEFYHAFSATQACPFSVDTKDPTSINGNAAKVHTINVEGICTTRADLAAQTSGDHLFTIEPEPADSSNITVQQYDYVYLKYWYVLNDGTRYNSRAHLAATIGDSDSNSMVSSTVGLTYYVDDGTFPAENAYFDTITAPGTPATIQQKNKDNFKTLSVNVEAATAYNNVQIRVSSLNDYGSNHEVHHAMCLDADQMNIDVARGLRFAPCSAAKSTQRFDYTADRKIRLTDQTLFGGDQCLKFDGYFKLDTCGSSLDFRFYRRVMNTKDDAANTPPRVIFHNLYTGPLFGDLGQKPSRCLDYGQALSSFGYKECGIWSYQDSPTIFELISN